MIIKKSKTKFLCMILISQFFLISCIINNGKDANVVELLSNQDSSDSENQQITSISSPQLENTPSVVVVMGGEQQNGLSSQYDEDIYGMDIMPEIKNGCLQFSDSYFSISLMNEPTKKIIEQQVISLENWEEVGKFDNTLFNNEEKLNILFLRSTDDSSINDELWIQSSRIVRFNISTKKWTEMKIEKPRPTLTDFYLFNDSLGDIWILWNETEEDIKFNAFSGMIGVFNEKTNSFTYPENQFNILENTSLIFVEVVSDHKGMLWFIFKDVNQQRNLLYSFDTMTSTWLYHSLEIDIVNLTNKISNRNQILEVMQDNTILLRGEESIYRYCPDDETTNQIVSQSEEFVRGVYVDQINQLLLDSTSKLWINGNSYLDMKVMWETNASSENVKYIPEQYYVLPSHTLFFTVPGIGSWTYASPFYLGESEDGKMWFSSVRGSGWLSTETGDWCVFTNIPDFSIYQDLIYDIWMIYDNGVYRYASN